MLGYGEKVDETPRIWAADAKASSDSGFVYTNACTSSTVASFPADLAIGALSHLSTIDLDEQPRGIAIDPRGRRHVVAGEMRLEVGVYAIEPQFGALKRTGGAPARTAPNGWK